MSARFAKSVFPALRLGFVIVPSDLHDKFLRRAPQTADLHPPLLEQMALADFIVEGHYARHLRRMRAAYRRTARGARRCGRALLRRRPPAPAGAHGTACRGRSGWCRRRSGLRGSARARRSKSRRCPDVFHRPADGECPAAGLCLDAAGGSSPRHGKTRRIDRRRSTFSAGTAPAPPRLVRDVARGFSRAGQSPTLG